MPRVGDEHGVDGAVIQRQVVGPGLVEAQARVALPQDVQHAPVGLDDVELETASDQAIGELAGPGTDLGDVDRGGRQEPLDRGLGVGGAPVVVLGRPGAEGRRAGDGHVGDLGRHEARILGPPGCG